MGGGKYGEECEDEDGERKDDRKTVGQRERETEVRWNVLHGWCPVD